MMKTIFTTVFSDGPGGGNPAPVFVEADSMTEEEMQKAAADLGQESVFVRKPVRPDCDLMLQYFVPDHELTICAHDTIGAITALKEEGRIEKEHLLVETKAGPVQVDWEEDEKGVLVMMEQFLPEFNDGVPAADDVAAALRIPASDLGASEKMPSVMHCVCDPLMSMMPRSVAKRTESSSCVMLSGLMQTSRVIGCLAENVPLLVSSSAHTPSEVKAYSGNCPNCPCDRAFAAEQTARMVPVSTVLMPSRGK